MTTTAPAPRFTAAQARALFRKAQAAAEAAGQAAVPTPMIVGTPKNLLGSLMGGDDGGLDPDKPIYFVNEGVCGFADVVIRPATSSFARWLAKQDIGYKSYYGGRDLPSWVLAPSLRGSQSLERAEAACRAAAAVLTEAGINAYVTSRMD